MIRAGRGGTFATDWVENSIIGIDWDFDGLDIANMDRDQIRAAYAAAHPAESKQKVATSVGQVFRFAHSMEQGSTVVMYDPAERLYHIGIIAGPCSPVPEPEGITYTSAATWNKTAPHDVFSQSSKNSLGGIQTIFAISAEVMADLESAAAHKRPAAGVGLACNPDEPAQASSDDSSSDDEALTATYDNGIELIKDRVSQLGWEDMERLVAGMLKAMGYCARVTPKGPDGGRDVIAPPTHWGSSLRASLQRSSTAREPWARPRCVRSSAGFARAIAGSTSPPGASPRKPATRPTAPMSPCAYSTSIPLFAITSRFTTRPTTRPAAPSRPPASGGWRSEQPRREFGHAASSVYPRRA